MKRFLGTLVAFLSVTLLAGCSSSLSQQSNQEKQTIREPLKTPVEHLERQIYL